MRIPALLLAVAAVQGVAEPALRAPATTPSQPSQVSAELGGMTMAAATKPIGLNPRAGTLHQQVSTDSERAQAYYDQGIAYLHSYVWVDAARSFHEALRLDAELAMAHMGLGKTYFNAEAWDAARAEFARASHLADQGNVTEKEVLWIALAQQQMDTSYAPPDQLAAQQAEYKAALDSLIQFDPDDAHAWVLRGNAEEAIRWGRGQRGWVGSIAYYESALQRNPDHFGAHHFLVHSYENIWHYGKAAEHGARLVSLAPDIPHAHHMYAHVLPRLGRWDEALRQLSIADRLHREYFAREGIAPAEDWHYPHNLAVLGTVQQRLGAVNETDRLYKELFETPNGFFRGAQRKQAWLSQLILEGHFEEAVREARRLAGTGPLANLVGGLMEAEALLRLGQIDGARQVRAAAGVAYDALMAATDHPIERRYVDNLKRRIAQLDALIALWSDDAAAGEAALLAAADAITARPGVHGWATGLFTIERLARAAEQAERPALATRLRARMKKIDPDYAPIAAAP